MYRWLTHYPGLDDEAVLVRQHEYGLNRVAQTQRYSVWRLFLGQFSSPLIYVLLVAMVITFVLGDVVDTVVIGLAVFVNTILGFWQEYKAEQGLAALSAVLEPEVTVLRDGAQQSIDVTGLVPGDLVVFESGERIVADGVLLEGSGVRVSEAVLTGESVPISKRVVKIPRKQVRDWQAYFGKRFAGLGEAKTNDVSIYAGSLVVGGSGLMVVVHTGEGTEVGKIAEALVLTDDEPTPLQRQLAVFSRTLAIVVGFLGLGMFGMGMLVGRSFLEMFTMSVAVAVSAIPEGLVVSLTAILALGMQRILKRKALVRKLVAAEVLGSVSVICSDKTGTLTKGEMRVERIVSDDEVLMKEAMISAANLKDPMEVAMWEWATGHMSESVRREVEQRHERVDRRAFNSHDKYSATLTQQELFALGAPDELLVRVRLSQKRKLALEKEIGTYARQGYRVIGVAHRKRMGEQKITGSLLAKPWYWLGMVLYKDPVREGLGSVLADAKRAGIGVVVITGDYTATAQAILKELKIEVNNDQVMEGSELGEIGDDELDDRIAGIRLFSRTSPEQKLKIVQSLQRRGEVVAMTGDGVNDAPALKKADIGVVVSNASDVSKETADLVLLDDNFATIIAAVEEGRGIYENFRKVLLYLLSDSFSEIVLIIASLVLGLPLPVTAAQILWVNLVNDGLPSLALTLEPKAPDLLERKPRKQHAPLMDAEVLSLIGVISLVSAAAALFAFWITMQAGGSLAYARTMAFAVLSVDSLVYVFSVRSLSVPLWRDSFFKNWWLVGAVVAGFGLQLLAVYAPMLQRMLETHPLTPRDWGIVLGLSMIELVLIEVTKYGFIHRLVKK